MRFLRLVKRVFMQMLVMIAPERMHMAGNRNTATYYDMYAQENEKFFVKLYMRYIAAELPTAAGRPVKTLDAGCGQGRLSIPLAKLGCAVDAVDMTPAAIEKAKVYAAEENAPGIVFHTSDIKGFLAGVADGSYDAVVCTEVIYMMPDYSDAVSELVRVTRKGGKIILGLRTKLFYTQYQLQLGDFGMAEYIASPGVRDGHGRKWFFNWCTKDEIERSLAALGVTGIKYRGVGVVSGIEGDPQASFAIPSKIQAGNLAALESIENNLSALYPESGRYMLVAGIKS